MKYPPDAAASDIETTTGFFLLSRFICRQISSDAVTSPPGESMRTTTPFTSESFSTPRRSLLKPYDVRLPSPAPSSPGLPRTMSPSPTITAMWLLPASPTDSAVIREYLSMETREGSALIRSFSSPHIWSSKRKASTNPAWSACGARAQKGHVSAVLPRSEDQVEISLHSPEWRVGRNQTRADVGEKSIFFQVGARNLADGAPEFNGVVEVDRVDRANGAGAHRFGRDPGVQSSQREDGQFGARVAAIQIFGSIGLRIPSSLGFFQCFAEGDSGVFDPAQNVVARPVQNSRDAVQPVSAQAGAQSRENRNASGDRGAELELASLAAGQF